MLNRYSLIAGAALLFSISPSFAEEYTINCPTDVQAEGSHEDTYFYQGTVDFGERNKRRLVFYGESNKPQGDTFTVVGAEVKSKEPPEGDTLLCHYKTKSDLKLEATISHMKGVKCQVAADNKGFHCTTEMTKSK